jgi:hypothetical protein
MPASGAERNATVALTFAAVVTGDVNASSRMAADQARRLQAVLRRCFVETAYALPQADLRGFSVYRGDAWQFVVSRAEHAVRAVLFFRSHLLVLSDREFKRRLHSAAAIGFGEVDYLPDQAATSGGGEAYERSGRRLDRLRKRIPGLGAAGAGDLDPYLDHLLGVIDALARQWTASRAKAVSMALQGQSQGEIASLWEPPVSQQAIQKHLAAAGWPALEPTLAWIETTLKGCFSKYNP